jgi:hypothetical protein
MMKAGNEIHYCCLLVIVSRGRINKTCQLCHAQSLRPHHKRAFHFYKKHVRLY